MRTYLNKTPGADNGIHPNHSPWQTGPIRGNGCTPLDSETDMIDYIILALAIAIGILVRVRFNHFPADDSDSNQGRRYR